MFRLLIVFDVNLVEKYLQVKLKLSLIMYFMLEWNSLRVIYFRYNVQAFDVVNG